MNPAASQSHVTAVLFGSMAFVFLNFSLPIYADDLGVGAVGIGAMFAIFTGTMLIVRPVVGWCLDRFGRKWFFVGAFLFYCLAMGVFAESSSAADFYVARFLQGIGASLMWVSARTIVADITDVTQRGEAMGQLMARSVQGSMIGGVYGFTLVGFMPMAAAWQWAFYGYAAAALIGFAWALVRVDETHAATAEALPRLVITPAVRRLLVVVLLSGFASALIQPIYLIFLKQKFALSVYELAVAFLPAGAVFAVLPKYAGRWSDRFGRARMIAIGVAFAGIVSAALPWFPSIALLAAFYVLFAVGWTMASPAEDALVGDLASDRDRGRLMGAKEAAAGVGAALGPLVGGFIYDYWAHEMAFVVNGALLLITSALAWAWFRPVETSVRSAVSR
jgi:MFS family permease